MKIENGKLKPAKALQDSLVSMLKGNKEFYLIDEQKVAYETVKKLVEKSLRESNKITGLNQKYTIIIKGGPGTGKSVVAIQLLCDLIQKGYSANYVTKNSAPRNVYFSKLIQNDYKKKYIENQVLEGFKFKDFVVDSLEKYDEIKANIIIEGNKKKHIIESHKKDEEELKDGISMFSTAIPPLNDTDTMMLIRECER